LHKPLDDLRLFDELAILLLDLGVEIAAFAEQHDDVEVAVGVEGLLVGDDVRVFECLEELSLLLCG
jgi:hypothetical protein